MIMTDKPSIIDFHDRRSEILRNRAVKDPLDFRETIDLLNRGRIDDAITGFRDLVKSYPGDPTVWYNLGFALGERGLIKESVEAYRESLKIDKYFHNARYNLALELVALNDSAGAEAELKALVELAPNDADAHYELGRLYEDRGLLDFALFEYDKVGRLKPDYRLINFCRANVLFRLKRHGDAAAAYRLELDRNPGFTEAHQMLQMVQEALVRKEKDPS